MRHHVDDLTCLFCGELELRHHLLFCCIVANGILKFISKVFEFVPPQSMYALSELWFWIARGFGLAPIRVLLHVSTVYSPHKHCHAILTRLILRSHER